MAKVKYYAKENSTIGTHSFYAVPIPNGTLTFDELLDEAMDGIEGMSSDSGILLGVILYFCHFLFVLMGLTTNYTNFTNYLYYNEIRISLEIGCRYGLALCPHAAA